MNGRAGTRRGTRTPTCGVCGTPVVSEASYQPGVILLYELDALTPHACRVDDVVARLDALQAATFAPEPEPYPLEAAPPPSRRELGGVLL